MIYTHPRPEAERIDWRGAGACWLATFVLLHLAVWLDRWPL